MLNSIRNQIFTAFLVLTLVMAGIGLYGVLGISRTGGIVTDAYDKPLMAINFAREASLTFSEMNNELLRQRFGIATKATDRPSLDELVDTIVDDLNVVRERSFSTRTHDMVDQIDRQFHRWDSIRRGQDAAVDAASAEMDDLSPEIIQNFDRLIELTAEDGFKESVKAKHAFGRYQSLNGATTAAALFFSIVVTIVLARRIVRPLSAAAVVANRIARGEFETAIPRGGADETGILLQSMTVMQTSIREMMEREAAQRRSAQGRLIDAVEGSGEGMILLDGERRILVVNGQVAAFFPSVADKLTPGSSFDAAFRGAKEKPYDMLTAEAWLKLLAVDGEIELANGRWLLVNSSATREGGRFMFLSDITPIKEREESLKAARRAAEAANIAKSEFLANMGHELRTPLNAIIGFSEIIAAQQFGPVGTPQYLEYAGDIKASGRHLLDIINDVLDLAKSADGKLHFNPTCVNIGEVFDECARFVARECLANGLILNVAPAADARYAWADEAKLRQILLNLVSNAIKFSPAGGKITLATCLKTDGMVELSVADTGIGMRAADIPTALAPFGQIDSALARKYEGTGLGLPLTKALAELHGGELSVESAPNKGTVIRVTLKPAKPELLDVAEIVPPIAPRLVA